MDDDDRSRRDVIRALRHESARIESVQAEVREAGTAAHARELLRCEEFVCVFLDHDLPGGGALGLLMDLRAAGTETPVFMLTGGCDERAITEATEAGATDFLPRAEMTPQSLGQHVRAALRHRQSQEQIRRTREELRLRDRAIAAASNGIIICDPHQHDCPIIYCNPAFSLMTGYTAGEALGRNCRFLQGKTRMPGLSGRCGTACATGVTVRWF